MLDEPRFLCIGLVLDTDSCLGPRPVEALDRDPEVNMLDVWGESHRVLLDPPEDL